MFKKIYFSNFHLKTNILAQLEFRLIPTEHTYITIVCLFWIMAGWEAVDRVYYSLGVLKK